MFDRAARFDRMRFDRPSTFAVYGSFVIDHVHDIIMTGTAIIPAAFVVDHTHELNVQAWKEQFGAFVMDHIHELEVTGTTLKYGSFVVESRLDLTVAAGRNRIESIGFEGEFRQGDTILIDSGRLTYLLNNQNALHLMTGDFFDLQSGVNELIYTDDQTGRSVRIRLEHRDKFV